MQILEQKNFLDIKCRKGKLNPSAIVIVATVRALKMHGGMDKKELKNENVEAVKNGLSNLKQHIANMQMYGAPVAVAINHFISDSEKELSAISDCWTH